jgi:intracellular sulfur oxidation DsrE/DsrF family protein
MSPETPSPADRRAFLGSLAAGTLSVAAASFPETLDQPSLQADPWLAALHGKHKQVFDAPGINFGFPLAYVHNYLTTMTSHYQLAPADLTAMLVVRNFGVALLLSDAIWSRYKLGAMWNITDPVTKAPALRNPYIDSKPGDWANHNASADRLVARGVVLVACGLALKVFSANAGAAAGVAPDVAHAEWIAGLLPGAFIAPSGVLAVGRAQESGCTYCYVG